MQSCEAIHPTTGNTSFFLDNLRIYTDEFSVRIVSDTLNTFKGAFNADNVHTLTNKAGKIMELNLKDMTLSIVDTVNGPLFTYALNCL